MLEFAVVLLLRMVREGDGVQSMWHMEDLMDNSSAVMEEVDPYEEINIPAVMVLDRRHHKKPERPPGAAKSNITCIRNTGQICGAGKDQCTKMSSCVKQTCVCDLGACAGGDVQCYKETNTMLLEGFTLQNARWPSRYMYISSVDHRLYVGRREDGSTYFDLYGLPGHIKGNQAFLLGSRTPDGNANNSYITYEGVTHLALTLVKAPTYKGAPNGSRSVMIGSVSHPMNFLNVKRFSQVVGLSYGDVGAGSYWVVNKPLPVELSEYVGPRCTWNCGFYASGISEGSMIIMAMVGVALVLALSMTLFLARK